jgi:WD40 repeat protein
MPADQSKPEADQLTTPWKPKDPGADLAKSDQVPERPTSPVSSILVGDTHTNAPGDTNPPRIIPVEAGLQGLPRDLSWPRIPGYEILSRVASGGMGVVYRARDLALDRVVALKVPKSGFISTPEEKERFLREARAAARLRHPNICPIYEVKEVGGQPYLSMAFIEGDTLRDWALGEKPGSRQIAELMATLSAAVQFAHDQKVVHRDLKPSNVMVEKHNSQPLLMDFGLAKDLGQEQGLTASGDVLGTPAYMAPEQAAGRVHDIGPRSDVYSLGAILYELLSGICPFKGTVGEVLVQVQNEEPRSLRKISPQVHADLETICQKAMAKAPAERYASAAELAADLQRFVRGDAILAKRQSWFKRAWRQANKNRTAAILGLCLLLVGVGLLVALPALIRKAQSAAQNLETSRLLAELEKELRDDAWKPANLPVALELVDRLAIDSPPDAEQARRAVALRLSEYITDRTRQKPDDQTIRELEEHIRELRLLDRGLADERSDDLDRRTGKSQRIATLQPPFRVPPPELPDARPSPDFQTLLGPAESYDPLRSDRGVLLNPASGPGNFQLDAQLHVPPKTVAALVISATQRHDGSVTALAVSPDGKHFASADAVGNRVRLFQAASGDDFAQLPGHRGPITSLAFSPDGEWLASAGWDGDVHVFRWRTQQLEQTLKIDVAVDILRNQSMAFGPAVIFDRTSKQLIATSGDGKEGGEIRRWSVPEFTPRSALRPSRATPMYVHLSAARDADRVAAGTIDNRVQIWDLTSDQALCNVALHPEGHPPNLAAMAFHPQGNLVAAASQGVIYLHDSQGTAQPPLQGFAAGCYALQFNSQGTSLAAGYENGTVKLWDVAQRAVRRTIPDRRRRCMALAFGPRGDWLLGGVEYGTVHLWETATGQERYVVDGKGYRFVIDRLADGPAVMRIERGTLVLREQRFNLDGDQISVLARRQRDLLELQVNEQETLVFRDFFPPRALHSGHWGVLLGPNAALKELIVRRSMDVAAASPLEQGDALLQSGAYAEAWELFEQQLADADRSLPERLKNEAALKSALSLRRLSRDNEAQEHLAGLGQTNSQDPAVVMARFELLNLLIEQGRFTDAEQLINLIRHTHDPVQIAEVVPIDFRRLLLAAYAKPLTTRSGFIQPGTLARLKSASDMAEFNQLQGELGLEWRMQLLIGLRMDEQHDDARQQAAIILAELEADAVSQDVRARHGDNLGNFLWKYGVVSRMVGEPRRPELLLNALLYDRQTNQLLPEVTGNRLALVLEKARVQAAVEAWPAVIETLKPLLKERDNSKIQRFVRGQAALLHGFALRHLNQEAAAKAAWQQHPYPPLSEGGRLDSLLAPEIIQLWMLRSLADDLTAAEADMLIGGVKLRLGSSVPAFAAMAPLIPISARQVQRAWRSGPGLRIAEASARGDRLPGEDVADALQIGAMSLFQQGAFPDDWSAQDEQLVWEFTHASYLNYCRDKFSSASVGEILLGWKGTAIFGWKNLVSKLPPDVQARGAYIIGCRRARQGNPVDAKFLWELSRELDPKDMPLQARIKAALAEPPAPP